MTAQGPSWMRGCDEGRPLLHTQIEPFTSSLGHRLTVTAHCIVCKISTMYSLEEGNEVERDLRVYGGSGTKPTVCGGHLLSLRWNVGMLPRQASP